MNEKLKANIIKCVITAAAAAAGTVTVAALNDFGGAEQLSERYRILSNAFTVPGVLLLMVGVLLYISTTGVFDTLGYALGRFARSLIPGAQYRDEKFYDYKTRKNEKRAGGYSCLFIVGAAFTLVAIVFLILYHTI